MNQNDNKFQTDVIIVGAGPTGLFAVFQCGMLGLKCHVVDSLAEIGGQCSALYPEKPIFDIPAYPQISANDLIENLEKQAEPFKPTYHLNQQVVSISDNATNIKVTTSKDTKITAKAIIIAGGAGSFGPNKPPLDNIEAFEGTSIFYMVRQKADFANKNIVIAGGGDSAVDWALSLAPIAKKLYVVHRRDKFRAAPDNAQKLHELHDKGDIELVIPYQLHGLSGDNGQLTSVEVMNTNKEIRSLEADILLPFYGLATDLGPIEQWNLDLQDGHILINPTTAETSQSNIYAIGDIAAYKNKKKLILTGFSEASFAAHHIYEQINPDKPLHFEYSTTKGLPNG